jgi:hypothetical protein
LDIAAYLGVILVLISFAVIASVKVLTLKEKGPVKEKESILDRVPPPSD